jgi:predicted HAD superfamily hydrolase
MLLNIKYRIFRIKSDKKYNPWALLIRSESAAQKRALLTNSTIYVKDVDVVSFDIFDTLVFRPFEKPEDLFYLLGEKLNYYDLFHLRKRAERELRKEKRVQCAENNIPIHGEVTIFEIWERLGSITGIDPKYGATTEIELEMSCLYANEYMKYQFNAVKAAGTPIIAVSNMYLPKEIMTQVLEKCGYTGFDAIYVSCDYHADKNSGELFDIVKNDFPNKRILHIDDNWGCLKAAAAKGMSTRYYPHCKKRNPYDTKVVLQKDCGLR